jgi:hypothetical protein
MAVLALWVRSYWAQDALIREWRECQWVVASSAGSCHVGWMPEEPESITVTSLRGQEVFGLVGVGSPVRDMLSGHRIYSSWRPMYALRNFSRSQYISNLTGQSVGGFVVFPLWVILVGSALSPMMWLFLRSRTAHSSRICPACGYDLRGTPSGGAPGSDSENKTCPECGFRGAVSSSKTPWLMKKPARR